MFPLNSQHDTQTQYSEVRGTQQRARFIPRPTNSAGKRQKTSRAPLLLLLPAPVDKQEAKVHVKAHDWLTIYQFILRHSVRSWGLTAKLAKVDRIKTQMGRTPASQGDHHHGLQENSSAVLQNNRKP